MKSKNLILFLTGFIFGLFIFLLPSFVEAACDLGCAICNPCATAETTPEYGGCCWNAISGTVERIGTVGNPGPCYDPLYGSFIHDSDCSSATFGAYMCKESGFPNPPNSNGWECTGKDGKWHASGCNYTECDKTGKWDASQSQCVECSGKIETRRIGDTSSVADVCNDNLVDITDLCESACGASSECDEKSTGACSTAVGYKCNSTCQKVSSCGDGTCNCGETCSSCSSDCGACPVCTSGYCCDTTTNTYRPSSYVCRASAGDCDIQEKCTGSSADCPSNSYRPSTYVCDDKAETDYGCPNGTACGEDVGVRYKKEYCPGDDDDCLGGTISGWGSYTTYDDCSSTETCADNDSTCNYTASCEGCTCTGWTNQSCGYSGCSCPSYKRGQTRTCTPSGCDVTCQCVCDESCCSSWTNQGCGAGGCAATEMHKTRDCGDCSYSESQCVSDPSCGAVGISPPNVETVGYTNLTPTSVTLNGYLHDLGGASTCLVWFEWGTSGTAGVSGSYGNKTTPASMTAAGPFTANLSSLTSNKTYYFEAFAKNGGSW